MVTQETTAMVHETKETCVKLNDYAEQLLLVGSLNYTLILNKTGKRRSAS